MATVVSFREENIENLIPKPDIPPPPKPPRFKSRFAEQVQEEYEVGRQGHLSMGEAATLLPHPEQYLRKYQGGGAGAGRKVEIKQRSSSAKTYRELQVEKKKAPVPKLTESVPKLFKSRKNIVHWNALNQMRACPPRQQETKLVDQPNGSLQYAEKAGLLPVYTNKKTYGRTPAYLERYKAELAEEKKRWEEEVVRQNNRKENLKVSEEERQALLQGLRCNWSLVNQTYQGLSLLTDTLYKKQRKVKVEEQLQKLERFIQILEKHTVIYIADNPYALL